MERYSKETIEKVISEHFKEVNIEELLNKLIVEERFIKEKNKREKASIKKCFFVYEKIDEGFDIKSFITKIVNDYDWFDIFDKDNGLPSQGYDKLEYFLIGNKLYEVLLHCNSEWNGEVGQYTPSDVYIVKGKNTNFIEIQNFEVLDENLTYGYITIKLT